MVSAFLDRLCGEPDSALSLIRRLFAENFRTYQRGYAFAFVLMAITAATTALSAWLIRDAVNDVFIDRQMHMVWVFGGAFLAISVVKGFSAYGQTVLLSQIGNAIVASMQRQLFAKVLQLGIGHFGRKHSSHTIKQISHNARAARDLMNLIATSFGRDLLTLVALIAVMVALDPLMSALTLLIAPPIILFMVKVVRRIRTLAAQEIETGAAVIATAQETSQGIRIIKSFTLEEAMKERVARVVRAVQERSDKAAKVTASTGPLMESLGGVTIALVLFYAGWQTIEGGRSPGDFMGFIVAFLLAYEPAKRLARFRVSLERSIVGVRMMYELIDTPPEEIDWPGAVVLDRAEGRIELDDVHFGYKFEIPVLNGVCLTAEAGEVIALVGPSGGGKTTIMNLIQRFYEPWSGTIRLDGHDIRDIAISSLRRNIAFVSQDTFLFTGTVRDNLQLGRLDAGEAELVEAAKAAQAWDFISAMPDGLDSEIGENGAFLSGGQRQRLAIARAILKNAPVLLLDEATSALDTQSERLVQAALERLMEGRTTIVIAHRLSTILRADRIHVVEDGRVVESGSHAELLAADGVYAELHQSSELDVIDDTAERPVAAQ